MKKGLLLSLAASVLLTVPSYAGFLVKKHPVKPAVETVVNAVKSNEGNSVIATSTTTGTAHEVNTSVTKKSILSRIAHKAAASAEMPKGLYIILAIFGFGWLAMGINDNFEDWDWIISLVLYLIGYLPGLIYTLVKMKKYYK